MADEELLMLTCARVARLSQVSERRLDHWEGTGLLHSTIEHSLGGHRRTRLYDFQDPMTAMVLSTLRERGSLQHIRQIVEHLRGLEYAVTEVGFAIVGDRVYFQTPEESWGDTLDPGQIVLHEVWDLEPLKAAVLNAGVRSDGDRGRVERRRGVHGTKPVSAGTRVPVTSVRAYLDAGRSQEILAAYPDLTPADIETVRALASA